MEEASSREGPTADSSQTGKGAGGSPIESSATGGPMAAVATGDTAAVAMAIPKGAIVRLHGLERGQFNCHVGRVVEPNAPNSRVGVKLHGVLWEEGGGMDADDGARFRSRRRPHSATLDQVIALRPENLRVIHDPRMLPVPTVLGTPSAPHLLRLLGETGAGFPDAIAKDITEYLCISWVSDVTVVGCSSNRGDYPLSAALDRDESTWWISAPQSMPDGRGAEFLEFSFGSAPQRVSFVGIRIPPMPYGPLSVRTFHLLALSNCGNNSWIDVGAKPLTTLDRGNLQEIAIVPPAETTRIRLVCTCNAAAAAMSESETFSPISDSIGLFQVQFM